MMLEIDPVNPKALTWAINGLDCNGTGSDGMIIGPEENSGRGEHDAVAPVDGQNRLGP